MDDVESIKGELERERRSLAMLSPNASISREKTIDLIRNAKPRSPPRKEKPAITLIIRIR